MRHLLPVLILLAALLPTGGPGAAQDRDLQTLFTTPLTIERAAPVASTPLEVRMGKLFLNAAANGHSREFIFDTGSPTILTREFADQLGLEVVGRNTGVDANGAHVTMDVAVLDSVVIGDVTFRNVPVMIFDYRGSGMGACLLDGGVLGSELLPGSAWRIDTEALRLDIAETAAALEGTRPLTQAPLHDFGYPHAPIVDYRVGEITDKALFDTGNAEAVTLFRRVADSPSVRGTMIAESVRVGRGSEGESAGGRGPTVELLRFTLSDFRVGDLSLGSVRATTRGVPPSLVGAGMLATHVVILDYPGQRFLLEPRSRPEVRSPEAGYAIGYEAGHAAVVQLFDGSAAARAGLRLGDRVIELQGRPLAAEPVEDRCESIRWLAAAFDPAGPTDIVVERDGVPLSLRLPAAR